MQSSLFVEKIFFSFKESFEKKNKKDYRNGLKYFGVEKVFCIFKDEKDAWLIFY